MIRYRLSFILSVCVALGATSSSFAQRAPFEIPDPDPEVERKSFIVADGFEVNLFAADPILAKPIQMNFDPQGRLWVVSSEVYPQIKPGQTANDKVLILEDRDGDGRAEKTSVFADGLLIPTGVEPGDGGVYVANSTELLHFADTDNDGKADRRRVMLSGFGTEDTHHILHTLRWGYDGMLYFNQSIYIHSHIETPHGVRRLGGGGIWRFRPETMELDVFIRGLVNPWGHHFDRWGQSFATDGAGGEGINYCLPGAYYVTAPDATRILQGLNPGSPKHCGAEFVSGRHLPESWSGSIVTSDFRGNRVCRFVLSEDGAGYASREQPELIKTKHMAFRPIDAKMGPDGAIYIADWYNPIIQHGEVDFRDPRRDHTRGRIWRVTAKGRPLVERPKLVGASTEALLAALRAPEDWTRQNARMVLKERGKSIVPALKDWVAKLDSNDPDAEHQRLEALWTYQAINEVESDLLATLLRSNDPRVRAAATRVASKWQSRLADPVATMAQQVIDDHPRVRLEAVRALGLFPTTQAAELAMSALDRPVDRFLDYALWLTARELAPTWLPEVQAGRFDFKGHIGHLVFALQANGSSGVVKPLVESLRASKIPKEQVSGVLTTVATLGDPSDLAMVLDLALEGGSSTHGQRATLLETLAKAARQRKVQPTGDLNRVASLLDGKDEALSRAAAEAAGAWKLESARPRLVELANAKTTSATLARSVVDALAEMGGPQSRTELARLAAPDAPGQIQALAISALASIDPNGASQRAIERLSKTTEPAAVESLLARFLQLQTGSAALTSALVGKTLPSDVAKVAIRAVRASGRPEEKLVEALTSAGQLASASGELSPEQMKEFLADVARLGDAKRGEEVFRRKEMSCLKCHAIVGAGGQVGPSLESIGASAPADYLVDSILLPSKAIKENYHALVVATSDGKIITGIKLRQTETDLILRDAEDQELTIPVATIEEQKPAGSLMPANLTDPLTRPELLDLVRFLSELGKIGPYSVSKARVVRRWRVLEPTPKEALTIQHSGLDAALESGELRSWTPAYSRVSGLLPIEALKPFGSYQGAFGMARAEIEVTTPGPLKLTFNSVAGMKLWVDDKKVELKPEVVLDLPTGVHTVTLGVDLSKRPDGIVCTLEDEPGSPARARVLVGK
ncbi:putative membrane-bound dehydrogenase domain-containing protein [Singulisphaera sp. GP187]|uniref:PVC-type heme-binding CxxCH protein n=1 Tax=Singulisphaera sp. GP187 TaxID=1882752 RepID=UPI0009294AED|nr:PVC-type heme-binding CxxCH protein [Singulisphaera sp. GP187]SIN90785.1 putative membrane-bound dehydrogenase domain-containing protein [Singulisphaera sp. GP187]